jgi:copper chaperone NosL
MTLNESLTRFYEFLDRPIKGWGRVILAVLVVPLVLSFTAPLWRISMEAPQYPKGLELKIYSHTIEGGGLNGQHLQEINTLNHYIGMHRLDRAALSDLDWLPFALTALALITLRCAAIGNVRALVDLVVMAGFFTLFSMGRFAYRMYIFGHDLAPDAPVKVKPFMPPLFGSKQIANFTTHSYPSAGSIFIMIFMTGIVAVLGWHLISGRRAAVLSARLGAP